MVSFINLLMDVLVVGWIVFDVGGGSWGLYVFVGEDFCGINIGFVGIVFDILIWKICNWYMFFRLIC